MFSKPGLKFYLIAIPTLTIDPGESETFSKGDQHDGEAGAVPIHDLENVDSTLGRTHR